MRKYYQATLVVVAALSVILLLIYRHEYYKLRYVLEVFSYFGKPGRKCDTWEDLPENLKLNEPVSSWQRLQDDLYVYSAYSIHSEQVDTIALGQESSIQNLRCIIYFDNDTKPLKGSFSYVQIPSSVNNIVQNSDFYGYRLNCKYSDKRNASGISFTIEDDYENINNVPILSVKSQLENFHYNGSAICIAPSLLKHKYELDMISFIYYHQLIDINQFLIYDFGISNHLNTRLEQIRKKYNVLQYYQVSWNFPFHNIENNVMRDILTIDCLYRMYKKVSNVIVLSWDEFLVLKSQYTFSTFMTGYNRVDSEHDRLRINKLIFCTEQEDDKTQKNSTLTVFRKTHYNTKIIDNNPIYVYKPDQILIKSTTSTKNVSSNLVNVNCYRACNDDGIHKEGYKYDETILSFFTGILNGRSNKLIVKNTFNDF